MSWKDEIEELKKREALAEKMGGDEKLKRQKDNKRLNVRQRIKYMLDKKRNREIRKIFDSLNMTVTRLIRVSYGKYRLGKLQKGGLIKVKHYS